MIAGIPEMVGFLGGFDEVVRGKLELPRHGRNGVFHAFSANDEQREDHVIHRQFGLPDHAAKGFVPAEPPRAVIGKQHQLDSFAISSSVR